MKRGRAAGKQLKAQFLSGLPALKKLVDGVQRKAKSSGELTGLDGRIFQVRSAHSALNTLLQGAGAIVCKAWLVTLDRELRARGLSQHVLFVANVHDEIQMEVNEAWAETVGQLAVECISKAGDWLGVGVPLTGEFKVGDNWKETH